jgi:hypothetical protein
MLRKYIQISFLNEFGNINNVSVSMVYVLYDNDSTYFVWYAHNNEMMSLMVGTYYSMERILPGQV